MLCALYSVLCTLSSVLCPLYSVLCTLYSVLCTLYSVLCTLYSVLCTLHSKDRAHDKLWEGLRCSVSVMAPAMSSSMNFRTLLLTLRPPVLEEAIAGEVFSAAIGARHFSPTYGPQLRIRSV